MSALRMSMHRERGKVSRRIRRISAVSIAEFDARLALFTPREIDIHEHQNRIHRERDQRGPLKQEPGHDQDETHVLGVAYARVRSGRRKSVQFLRCIQHLPCRGKQPESRADQDVADDTIAIGKTADFMFMLMLLELNSLALRERPTFAGLNAG